MQCLTTALEQKGDFEEVVRTTAAFVSLATPHTTSEEVKDWCQPQLLSEAKSFHRKIYPTTGDDAKRLGNLYPRTISTSRQVTGTSSETRKDGPSLSDFSTTKRDPLLPCHIIPFTKNRDFHDRVEVLQMIEKCLSLVDEDGLDRKELRTFALCGPGGMGKTQVANEYAITHMDTYEAILWVDAEEPTTLMDEFSQLAEHLGLVLEGSPDARDQALTRELVKGWLAKPVRSYNRTDNSAVEEVPWLLVFDNVNNPDLLSDLWPPDGSTGSILITSRDNLAKTQFYQIKNGIDLPPMSQDDASDLLLKLTWRENDPEEQRLSLDVADILGGLPLALTQMAGVMIRQSLSFANFLNRYGEEEEHAILFNLSLEPKHKRANYGHTLASVWSLEKLEYSSGLLDVMAFLYPTGIPEKYLEGAVGTTRLTDYPKTVTAYQNARSELLKSSLVMTDRSSSNLTIHRLIQDAARARMDTYRITTAFSDAVDILRLFWPEAERGVRHHIARWKDCEVISLHIVRLKDHFLRAPKALKLRWSGNLNFAMLINELEARNRQEKNTITREDGERIFFLLSEIHNNIAGSATELNDPDKALHHFERYNQLLRDRYEKTEDVFDSRLTSSYYNLGMSYAMKKDYANAVKYIEIALKEAGRLQNPESVKAARSLGLINLALTLWLMGRHEEASSMLTTALREREELLGSNDRDSMITGRVLYGLGNVRHSQGLLEESLLYHERALLHFKETVGSNHHRTGNSCFKVAQHYSRIGRLSEAINLLDQAIKILDRHECYVPEKGRATLMKGIVLQQQSKSEESKICFQRAAALYEIASKRTIIEEDLTLQDFDAYVHIWGR
ncbi:conserved hypothetical protein [Talaromyces stipitatus ATCC 10500]|uniref:DUF7779 domain-containing protein n=1 Tax=Talaromyces stipitatus (strain ATCC 10500 / CBS 375.48 / QM 6759 / NRRL 1006) TaxID=441959 RepID=B8M2G5_TALSN|nr:uncharacterized protein TSTA_088650 [Talaromyces stipitatus ATCC 10500]EED21629.1 conserved hypothetical protein [Talaromyces stipitatus ATCC 10500]